MFKSIKRVTYQVDDLEKAKQWYSGILGTNPVFDTPFAVIFKVGDCSLSLSKAAKPWSEASSRMDVFWEVDDIDLVFNQLIERGARIQQPVTPVLNISVAKVLDPFGNCIGLSGKPRKEEKKTVEEKPSETAMSAAFCRALAFKDDREEIQGPDFLAEQFLTDEARKTLADAKSRKWMIENVVTSPLYGFMIARTAFLDAVFKKACQDEISQIVFLGAGYDTRSYRFKDSVKKTKIFELDIHTTQQKKVEILIKKEDGSIEKKPFLQDET